MSQKYEKLRDFKDLGEITKKLGLKDLDVKNDLLIPTDPNELQRKREDFPGKLAWCEVLSEIKWNEYRIVKMQLQIFESESIVAIRGGGDVTQYTSYNEILARVMSLPIWQEMNERVQEVYLEALVMRSYKNAFESTLNFIKGD